MNKLKTIHFAFFVAISLLLFSCQKSILSDTIAPTDSNNLVATMLTSTSGFVTNENNLPVQGATVTAGAKTTITDKYGYFEINNAELVKNAAFVTVVKPGYFKGIKTWIANDAKPSFFRIKLLPKINVGTVNATTGGDVTLVGGMKIIFPAGGVKNAITNAAYAGTVSVLAQWLNPTATDLNSIMPGDLRGKDASGALKLLTTYGMAAVELVGSAGELLQIANGKKATLSMPIPTSILANAPATIPLWHFDENLALWKEEGTATKVGNTYVGDVAHFSFWNCDVPNNYVQFNCTVVNTAGLPVQNAVVKISMVSNPNNAASGCTNEAGYVNGAVPNNANLLLEVFGNYTCNTAAFSQTFNTTNTNITYGNVVINTTTNLATINGSVTNCSNAPVTNGYIILQNGYVFSRYNLSATGTYSINQIRCSAAANNINFVAEDITAAQQSNNVVYPIVSGVNNIPTIQACGISTSEYVNITVNSVAINYTFPTDSLYIWSQGTTAPVNYVRANRIPPSNTTTPSNFSFTNVGIAVGSVQNLNSFSTPTIPNNSTINTPIGVNITEYGAVGQYIAGNFSGVITGPPPTLTLYNITCNFRLRR
ncbi:MAG: carboxypeptidase-like regulatory domain-containing protein [Ferruginibacter sp.]|nr:carboxypeptidase regulatory-like domain-containing protein [Ferruginibacter sp.]